MTSPTRRGSLKRRILVVLALASVVPTLVVGGLAIRRARADLEREVVRGNLALIRALAASLDGTLQDARRTLELAAAAWADGRSVDAPRDPDGTSTSPRLVRRLRRSMALFRALSIASIDGTPLYGDPIEPGDLGAHSFGGYIGDVGFDDGRPHVRMVTQARSRTGELVGVFAADLDLGFIADALAEARLGAGAELLVVDGRGVVVARSRGGGGGQRLRGKDGAVDRALGSTTEGETSAGGVVAVYRNLASFQSLRGVAWSILLEQPEREAYAVARKTTRDTLILAGLALGLCLALGAALAVRLTRPLADLARRADAIADGMAAPADAPPAPVDAPGEIGLLAQRFEEMARRLGERERLQQALARGDRLAAVGTMAASVAHEVNNPLTTVLGYARLLLEDKPADHPDRAGLELVASEAARMKTIVGSLLDYARTKPAEGDEPADVNQVLRRTAALIAPSIKHQKVDLALELVEPLPRAAAELYALQQVFFNLVHNAAQAMPGGGTVTVTSGLGPGAVAIEVVVSDQGPGVPEADRERVFEPFYTTKTAGAGTGLGLAVCRHLVAGFRGSIEVGPGPGGRGAGFRVVIPIAPT